MKRLCFVILTISMSIIMFGCSGGGGSDNVSSSPSHYRYNLHIAPDSRNNNQYDPFLTIENTRTGVDLKNPKLFINGIQISTEFDDNLPESIQLTPGQSVTIELSHPDFPSVIKVKSSIPTAVSNLQVQGDISRWIAKNFENIQVSWNINKACTHYYIGLHLYDSDSNWNGSFWLPFSNPPAVISNHELEEAVGSPFPRTYPSYVGFTVSGANVHRDPTYPYSGVYIKGIDSNIISNLSPIPSQPSSIPVLSKDSMRISGDKIILKSKSSD